MVKTKKACDGGPNKSTRRRSRSDCKGGSSGRMLLSDEIQVPVKEAAEDFKRDSSFPSEELVLRPGGSSGGISAITFVEDDSRESSNRRRRSDSLQGERNDSFGSFKFWKKDKGSKDHRNFLFDTIRPILLDGKKDSSKSPPRRPKRGDRWSQSTGTGGTNPSSSELPLPTHFVSPNSGTMSPKASATNKAPKKPMRYASREALTAFRTWASNHSFTDFHKRVNPPTVPKRPTC